MLFAYSLVLLASYTRAASGYLPPDERSIGNHAMVTSLALVFVGLAVSDGVRSRARIYFLLRVMVVGGSLVAFVGIVQFLFSYDLTPHLRPPGMHFTVLDPRCWTAPGCVGSPEPQPTRSSSASSAR